MNDIKLGKRLSAAAELCREGSFIADVGTDHAYLPIALWQKGRIRGGVASDINQGPIDRARAHISEYGAAGAISAIRCDGLSELEPYAPEDIFILGMGGELIVRILENAPWTRNKGTRLILQPMTHPEAVRAFLWDNGYGIFSEKLVKEERIYHVIGAEYAGELTEYDEMELLFGKINLSERSSELYELFERTEEVMKERIRGKELGGGDTAYERKIIERIGEKK